MSKEGTTPVFYVLEEDKLWAQAQIAKLEKAIQDMGPDFNVALNQSSETWHDNAPFDALRDEQAILVSEMQSLKEILFKASLAIPKPRAGRVGIGSVVIVKDGSRFHRYFLAGHWSPFAGHRHGHNFVISYASPLGSVLFDAKIGDAVVVPTNKHKLVITEIDPS